MKVAYTAIYYTLISWENIVFTGEEVFKISVFFSFYIFTGIFGYITNDISDEKSDKAAGKTNVTARLSVIQKLVLSFVLAVIGVAPISFYAPPTIPFVVAEILLLVAYTFPPFRLKERGILGVITDSLYAYVIPMLIMLVFLDEFSFVSAFYWYFLPLFGFFIGLKNILNHQFEDLDNDQISGVKTFAIEQEKTAQLLEVFSAIFAVGCWVLGLVYVLLNDFPISIIAIFIVVSCVFLFRTVVYFIYRDAQFLASIPEFDLIYYGTLILIIFAIFEGKYQFIFLSIFFITPLFRIKIRNTLISVWFLILRFLILIRRILSFIVNYSLYYSFLIIGIDLKERAKAKEKNQLPYIESNDLKVIDLREKNVHGLWIGVELSLMEMLTIKSFIEKGYVFHIWTYDHLINDLPEGCIICDANEIIPVEKVFKYKYSSQFGTGKGSYAGFSDIFRYKLLYEKGGWWVDMDVTCLKPFDVEAPYFFRAHHVLPLVGNIMKVPKGSELMLRCYEEASKEVDETNRDWHKPIEILIRNVHNLGLDQYIVNNVTNSDEWHVIEKFVLNIHSFQDSWYFVHWCNEMWRTQGISKNSPFYSSTFGEQLTSYLLLPLISNEEKLKNDRSKRNMLIVKKINNFV